MNPGKESNPSRRLLMAQIECPNCHQTEVITKRSRIVLLLFFAGAALMLFYGLFQAPNEIQASMGVLGGGGLIYAGINYIRNGPKKYECRNCGHIWKFAGKPLFP